MKNIFLFTALLITTSISASASGSPTSFKGNNPGNDDVLVVNIRQLREETKNVSLLKPVFAAFTMVRHTSIRIHGKKISNPL